MDKISEWLLKCNANMPSEMHRAVRSLKCMSFWKALEFRTFLLYLGPVILKDHLPREAYVNFLYLFCAVRICSSERYRKYFDKADMILRDFIEQYIDLYGAHSVNSNVHNLCHLVDDVKRFGVLPKTSAYPFENMLYCIKNLLRHGKNPLAQAANRLSELSALSHSSEDPKVYPYVDKPFADNKFRKVYYADGFTLCNNTKDKWFLTKSKHIVAMEYCTVIGKKIYICGSSIPQLEPFFYTPFQSTHLRIYYSEKIEESFRPYDIDEIDCKMVALDYRTGRVFIPLLHTLD